MAKNQKLSKDVLMEILAHLPLKSVKRLRNISKSWCTLIESPTFIDRHLLKDHKNGRMLLVKRHLSHLQKGDEFSFYGLNVEEQEDELWPKLSIPFVSDQQGVYEDIKFHDDVCVVGPCNGLVCIFLGDCFMLCNPILREFKKLPPHNFSCPEGHFFNNAGVGFGVTDNKEYKVVLIGSIGTEYCYPDRICTTILLYNSRADSWRQMADDHIVMSCTLCCSRSGILLNGACHWDAQSTRHKDSDSVLTFDISTEVFGLLQYSDSMEVTDGKKPILMVQNGCLALAQFNYDTESSEIWVMKEYGVKDSWTRQFEIGPQLFVWSYLCFKSDDCLLVESHQGRLVYYDFNTNDFEILYVHGNVGTLQALILTQV